jgi:hypothetical protein
LERRIVKHWMPVGGVVPLVVAAMLATGCARSSGLQAFDGDAALPPTDGDAAPPMSDQDSGAHDAACMPGDPAVPSELLQVCAHCPDARCVPNFAVTDEMRSQLLACDELSTCVPELYIETNGRFTLDHCTSVDGAEGRCMSLCSIDVANQADVLPQDVCHDGWLCAPCVDPDTGASTGACSQGCEAGPS